MGTRIEPANLRDLPTVLSTQEVANVLRLRPAAVRKLAAEGKLRRLRYSRTLLFASTEVERFLAEYSGTPEDGRSGQSKP